MLGTEEKDDTGPGGTPRKTFWRSASWSVRSPDPNTNPNSKPRSCLPPLQPLSISRRTLIDDWPIPGSDDLGEWPNPPTPRSKQNPSIPTVRSSTLFPLRKDKLAFFDKECSRIADHIYLGSDAVARNREILRQNGITHVLNCVGFMCPEYFKTDLVYKTLWLQDTPSEDITSILYDVFDYFEDVREQNGRVLVHCYQGVSRSTSLVIAYLMWRDGQSFEDAFQFVKAARGITNPNMGFACQLLQCQKRVHAVPVSPASVLRMYRMAPHSPYDPLHLVPKLLNNPSALALDSRGAFLVHIPIAIYVWIGKECGFVMAKNARLAACQVVRYERVQGPIISVGEGEEPAEFWDALASGPLVGEDLGKMVKIREQERKDQVKAAIEIVVGKKKVELYDVDFEIFWRALRGGVVPPFSLLETGFETHLPARENGWGRLRQKFASGGVKELLNKVTNTCNEEKSPLCCSPDSFSCDSKSSFKSSSLSPSDSSSLSTFSPVSSNCSDFSFSSSQSSPKAPEFIELSPTKHASQAENACLPCKGSLPSLAERRGGNAPSLKLLASVDQQHQLAPTNLLRPWSFSLPSLDEDVMKDSVCLESEDFHKSSRSEKPLDSDLMDVDKEIKVGMEDWEEFGKSHSGSNMTVGDGLTCSNPLLTNSVMEGQKPLISNDLIEGISDLSHPILFQWPTMEKVEMLHTEALDSRSVFLLLAPTIDIGEQKPKMLYVWVGRDVSFGKERSPLINSPGTNEDRHIYWERVGHDFLYQMGLPMDIPVEIIREDEGHKHFLTHLKSGSKLS